MAAEAALLQNRNESILLNSNCRIFNGLEITGSISRIRIGRGCRYEVKGVSRSFATPFSASLPSSGADPSPVVILKEKPDRSSKKLTSNEEPQLASDSNHKAGYVALIGKPNVGKSTLMNRIIGQKLSIVTNKPQTTRHRILGICSSPEYQMIFCDTPGIMSVKRNKLEEMMMQNVNIAMLNADCVLVVVNAADDPIKVSEILEETSQKLIQSRPSLLVMNKKDVIKPGEVAKKMKWYQECSGTSDVLAVSAKLGHGIAELKEWIVSKLPHGPALYPKEHVSDQPERFFAAEIVREKIFLQYFKEIPYVSQVNTIKFVPRTAPAKDFIELEIIVEKELQKAIIIGKEGAALKALATTARANIEELLGREVYLEIKVKVKEDWRANECLLKSYGYS